MQTASSSATGVLKTLIETSQQRMHARRRDHGVGPHAGVSWMQSGWDLSGTSRCGALPSDMDSITSRPILSISLSTEDLSLCHSRDVIECACSLRTLQERLELPASSLEVTVGRILSSQKYKRNLTSSFDSHHSEFLVRMEAAVNPSQFAGSLRHYCLCKYECRRVMRNHAIMC